MIIITRASEQVIQDCEQKMQDHTLLFKECRTNHTAVYPLHTRYFSNGDKPWVILINLKNEINFTYYGKEYVINENELVFFDDNVLHSWEMNNNDMTIYYYRAKSENPITEGTYYCYFGNK
jgi:hypothetical protein